MIKNKINNSTYVGLTLLTEDCKVERKMKGDRKATEYYTLGWTGLE